MNSLLEHVLAVIGVIAILETLVRYLLAHRFTILQNFYSKALVVEGSKFLVKVENAKLLSELKQLVKTDFDKVYNFVHPTSPPSEK